MIHSDLRPENFLVHQETDGDEDRLPPEAVSIWLCDFGGSKCEEHGLEGKGLPDTPFFDPRMEWESSPATDIFSLGSIFYTIYTGHWPFRDGRGKWSSMDEKHAYEARVDERFGEGHFPEVSHLLGGNVIQGCWDHRYTTAEEVLDAVRTDMVAPRL